MTNTRPISPDKARQAAGLLESLERALEEIAEPGRREAVAQILGALKRIMEAH